MSKPEKSGSGKGGGSNTDWYILAGMAVVYVILLVVDTEHATTALSNSWSLALTIAPILLRVSVFVGLSHYAVSPQTIASYIGAESGVTGYAIAIGGGILSHGPVYAWYHFLADLRERGMRDGLIAVFLYNRAIKLPLLPMFLYYFEVEYAAVLFGIMIVASIFQGIVVERLVSPST